MHKSPEGPKISSLFLYANYAHIVPTKLKKTKKKKDALYPSSLNCSNHVFILKLSNQLLYLYLSLQLQLYLYLQHLYRLHYIHVHHLHRTLMKQ